MKIFYNTMTFYIHRGKWLKDFYLPTNSWYDKTVFLWIPSEPKSRAPLVLFIHMN